ncbi:MAG TPA: DUF2935 domain-containing protein [Thermoanaerobaculia bacterium]|nr:DUF2935 domain-containing protein [Thermoanaerobaculia bacterium]
MIEESEQHTGLTRRELVVLGGIGAVGTLVTAACGTAGALPNMTSSSALPAGAAKLTTKNGGIKDVVLPAAYARDAVSLSVADSLFWTDIMMEHALFFALLMPGDDLRNERAQAQSFQQRFAAHLTRLRGESADRSNYAALNRATTEIVRPFVDFKHKMQDAQTSGRLHSLVWPLFFEHTAREGERFVARLDRFSRNETESDRSEVIQFWSQIMAEHSDFIAHLLDPEERELIRKAFDTSTKFHQLRAQQPPSLQAAHGAAEEIINFKTAAEKGIQTGKIKSIINPALADHVRREAVKFADELKRVS